MKRRSFVQNSVIVGAAFLTIGLVSAGATTVTTTTSGLKNTTCDVTVGAGATQCNMQNGQTTPQIGNTGACTMPCAAPNHGPGAICTAICEWTKGAAGQPDYWGNVTP